MKKALKKLFYPNMLIVVFSIPVAVALMMVIFELEFYNPVFCYPAYIIVAYSLIIVCIRLYKMIEIGFVRLSRSNQFVNRYMHDIAYRTKISLYQSLSINLIYAITKLCTGIYYASIWLITLAFYYILLVFMRFSLLQHTRKEELGDNLKKEYIEARNCGIILIFLNVILAGLIVLIVLLDNGFVYSGYFIYVMAIYTFYTTILAIVNLVKYKKEGSPVLSAAKSINLTVALVSMLSLEVAMLAQLDITENIVLDKILISITGGIVCIINLVMAIHMITKSFRKNKITKVLE